MATLNESAVWEDGIYQLEVSDPVLGGPGGIANRQAEQLANRTNYLKTLSENHKGELAAHVKASDPHTQYAPKHSPALSGIPTAPTAAQTTRSTQIATTAFVHAAVSALVNSSPAALDTLKELADALGNDPDFSATMTRLLSEKAPLSNPAFTGNPTATTQPATDNSTRIATTAFVRQIFAQITQDGYLPIGVPIPYPLAQAPANWMICNGAGFSSSIYPELAKLYPDLKVPDLRGLFIRGWSHGYNPDSGRTLLSRQESAFAEHKHTTYVYSGQQQPQQLSLISRDPSDTMLIITTNKGVNTADGSDSNNAQYMTGIGHMNCVIEGKKNNLRTAAAISTAKMINGVNETRPVNMAFNYILRAK